MRAVRHGSLGVLLASDEGGGAVAGARSLIAAAVDAGREVFLYLLHEGTRRVHDADLQSLRARGLRMFCCAFGARRRGMEADDAAVYCGLGMLADIVATVDEFGSFTGSRWDGGAGGAARHGGRERRRVQVRVSADPGSDDRAAEGVRVAAGLLASGRLDVGLVFCDAGRRCLESGGEAQVDGRDLAMHLKSYRESGGDVRAEGEGEGGSSADLRRWFAVLGF